MQQAVETTEKRTMRAHANLIMITIQRQAGTLAKAVMEGIMNSIDKDAKRIDVQIKADRVVIEDNGTGFNRREDITDNFEEFGRPHELDDNGISQDAKFGTFRIGRGQLFCFGVNTWESGQFRMITDIQTRGLDYDMTSGVVNGPKGCKISIHLYESLGPRDITNTVDEIVRLCKYVTVDLRINGKSLAVNPAKMKWDVVNDQAYIKINKPDYHYGRGLDVYHQGVFVETVRGDKYGLEGTIVVKAALKVNTARNQVIRSCKTWKKIDAMLVEVSAKAIAGKTKLADHEASHLLARIGDGEVQFKDWEKIKCLSDTNGNLWSPEDIANLYNSRAKSPKVYMSIEGRVPIALAPRHDKMADRVMQMRKALVLDSEILKLLQTTERGALTYIAGTPEVAGWRFKLCKVADLVKDLDFTHNTIPREQLTPMEKDALDQIQSAANQLAHHMHPAREYMDRGKYRREIMLGESLTAEGWTDGKSMVAINRKYLQRLNLGMERDWNKLMMLVLHEFCHDSPSSDTHNHTEAFYRTYHDFSDYTATLARAGFVYFRQNSVNRGRKLPQRMQRDLNLEAEAYVTAQMVYKPEALEAAAAETKAKRKAKRDARK